MTDAPIDFDSPWKVALEEYLNDFLAFFFPQAHADIDWSRGYVFLDTELQQVVRDAELGRRLADKLVRVWRRDGAEAWVLIHIEVQSQEESDFAERMFVYHYRLYDRYHRQIVNLAVLGDERAGWRPSAFDSALWGCELAFRFPIVKLLDYQERRAELEASRNPFATVVLAHLTAQATRHNPVEREQAKFALMRRLYESGYSRTEILNLFRFIDWLLQLPEALAEHFWQELRQYEEARQMSYITSVEEIGRKAGRQEGLLAGLEVALQVKFGDASQPVVAELQHQDLSILQAVGERLKTATTLEEIRQLYTT